MGKVCKKKHEERGKPRSSALTLQTAAQRMKALPNHTVHRSFSPLPRRISLKAIWLATLMLLAGSKNPAARCGKIYEATP